MLETYPVSCSMREQSSSREFPRSRFQAETEGSRSSLVSFHPGRGHTQRQLADAPDHAHPLGDANGPSGIQQIEDVRALENLVIGGKHRVRHLQQSLALFFVQVEKLPEHADVGE